MSNDTYFFSPGFGFVGHDLKYILIILFLCLFLHLQCLAPHMPGTWQSASYTKY